MSESREVLNPREWVKRKIRELEIKLRKEHRYCEQISLEEKLFKHYSERMV